MTAFPSKVAVADADHPGQSPTVLVVDDDTTLLTVLARELRRRGFAVRAAAGGVEAVEEYARAIARIDVVLMDVNMPGVSGPDALDAILALDPFVRCCFMTADDRPGRHAALLARGAAAVFGKPFASVKEMCETLKRIGGETDSPAEGRAKWRS